MGYPVPPEENTTNHKNNNKEPKFMKNTTEPIKREDTVDIIYRDLLYIWMFPSSIIFF